MKNLRIIGLTGVLLATLAPEASAKVMEYYTYNGFEAVVSAFQKVALIFGDGNYQSLFYAVTTIGILISGAAAYYTALRGVGHASLVGWSLPAMLGIAMYFALIVPKGTLNIYDPVKNRFQAVGNIPDGLVVIVGSLNLIERGLIDVVSAAADPESYQTQAGGVGFNMLLGMSSKGIILADPYMHTSFSKYIEDCVFFEMERPGTTLTLDRLNNNTDFMAVFNDARNPAVFTTLFTQGMPEGATMTCTEAADALQIYVNDPANFAGSMAARCADAGFDPTIPAEFVQCQAMITNITSWFEGAAVSFNGLFRQTLMAQSLSDTALSHNTDLTIKVMAARNTGSTLLSTGVVANDWYPVIRASLIAIAVSMVPFLALLIPTPLVKKALMILIGFFVWLTMWGIIDAIVHSFATDYAYKAFEEVRQNGLGLAAVMNFSTSSLKTLAAFAALRWSGLMLASLFTSAIGFFAGHALGMLANNITSPAQSSATAAARVATPEGLATTIGSLETAPAMFANAHKFDFTQRSQTHTVSRMGDTMGKSDLINSFGMDGATRMFGDSVISRTMGFGTRGAEYRNKGLLEARDILGFGAKSSLLSGEREKSIYKTAEDSVRAKFGHLEGAIDGAGGLDNYITQLHARGKGETASELASAKIRSGITGEDLMTSLTNNKVDGAKFEALKNLASGKTIEGYGEVPIVGAMLNREGQSVAAYKGDTLRGSKAGYDLNSPDGILGYHLNTNLADGANITMKSEQFRNEVLKPAGINEVSVGDQDTVLTAGLRLNEAGQPMAFSAVTQDGRLIEYKDGKVSTQWADENGFVHVAATNKDGVVSSHTATRTLQTDTPVGSGFVAGKGTEEIIKYGDGGKGITTFNGVLYADANGDGKAHRSDKLYEGHFTFDSHGKPARIDAHGGTTAIRHNETFSNTDTRDKVVEGGAQIDLMIRSADGRYVRESGVAKYDQDLKQYVLQSGDRQFGINQSWIRYKDAEFDAKGDVTSLSGWVYENVRVTPGGKLVAGDQTSIIASKGQISIDGQLVDATIYRDSRSNMQLATEGKSGAFYTKAIGGKAWTHQMPETIRGNVAASGIMKSLEKMGVDPEQAQDIGYSIGVGMQGAKEVGGLVGAARDIRGKSSTYKTGDLPEPKDTGILDQYGKPIKK